MKKPHVLNRAMFNQGGTSAYGKGITSNLVSEEQRQRFNYGGRVGLKNGLMAPFYNTKPYTSKPWDASSLAELYQPTSVERFPGETKVYEDMSEEDVELLPGIDEKPGNKIIADWYKRQGPKYKEFEKYVTETGDVPIDPDTGLEREVVAPGEKGGQGFVDPSAVIAGGNDGTGDIPKKIDPASDVIDWETFAEGLYDKKGAKGKAQLELAGNVLAAAFQPKKEAMAILGKGLGDFGKTASARKEKMEDIAATGKMYDKIYKTRAIEKGKQDRLTQLNKIKTGNPWTDYQAALLSLKDKDDAIDFATGETVRTLTIDTETKEVEMPSDGTPGELFKHPITHKYFLIDKDGKPQPININKYLKNLKLA